MKWRDLIKLCPMCWALVVLLVLSIAVDVALIVALVANRI